MTSWKGDSDFFSIWWSIKKNIIQINMWKNVEISEMWKTMPFFLWDHSLGNEVHADRDKSSCRHYCLSAFLSWHRNTCSLFSLGISKNLKGIEEAGKLIKVFDNLSLAHFSLSITDFLVLGSNWILRLSCRETALIVMAASAENF